LASGIYRTPDERFVGLPDFPYAPRYVELGGLRTHYLDEGAGEQPILLIHGEPTWSFLYRSMIPPLRPRFRCIAPDYVGFGCSDKLTEVAAYSFGFHYDWLERFVDALGLTDLTVVVQDWGGPLGLRYATRHPERVARLVILNTGLMSSEAPTLSPGLVRWREYALRTPDLMKPALVCFSDSDPVFSPAVGRAFADLISTARFALIAGAGHFLQEEKGPDIASRILDFVRDRRP